MISVLLLSPQSLALSPFFREIELGTGDSKRISKSSMPAIKLHKDDDARIKLAPAPTNGAAADVPSGPWRQLIDPLRAEEAALRLGGGPENIDRQHKKKRLTARERIAEL